METGENKSFILQSDSFNIALASNYHLSIQIGITHFSYCLLNTTTLTYEYIKQYNISSLDNTAAEISEIINADLIIKNDFSSESIAFINFPSTLVPETLYKEEDAQQILLFSTGITGKVIADNIVSQKAYLLYTIPNNIIDIATNFFPNARKKAQESILLEQYSQLNTITNKAYIYLNEKKALITIFKGSQLILNNTFEYTTKEDLLYFVLFSFEQLKLSTEEINVTLFGVIEKEDMFFNLLYKYIRNIKLGKRPHQFTFPTAFNAIAQHKYFGLFTQVLCV